MSKKISVAEREEYFKDVALLNVVLFKVSKVKCCDGVLMQK